MLACLYIYVCLVPLVSGAVEQLDGWFRSLTREKASNEPYVPKHNLKMAEGQTIKINIKSKKKEKDDDDDGPKSAAPMVSLGAAFGDMSVGNSPAAANPFAAAPATKAAPAPASNPFAASSAPADDPFASKPAASDEFGSFASGGDDKSGGGGWVAF
eukprot:TRINITY_DN3665_c0_g1_i2.p1 TRINITY_DN3665_c0_g1~~TRINITY_DN3665_c0_g1_i2.p1  ORF type:complete len:157 (+),score=20.33 TRINITY_DN3665_c0_g1_i2:405-875(+)